MMANVSIKNSVISPANITAGIFGLALILSVFLPWLAPSQSISSRFGSVSAFGVSNLLGLAGLIGGLISIGLVLMPASGLKKALHVLVGLGILGLLAFMLYKGTLPLLSAAVRKYVGIGLGVYFFGIGGAGIALVGMAERSSTIRRPLSPNAQTQGRVAVPGQPVYPPPQQYTSYSAVGRFCPRCGKASGNQSAFCGECGASLPPIPPAAVFTQPPLQVFCSQCGKPNAGGLAFCGGCGSPLSAGTQYQNQSVAQQMPYQNQAVDQQPVGQQRVSGAWWLLPIFLGAPGGIIAFFAVFKRKAGMAWAMLILGIILSTVAFLVVRNFLASLSDLGIIFG